MKAIYKSAALLFGAMSLFSSCEDFLTRDPQDSYLLEGYMNTEAKLNDYTKQIYGPLTWNGFDDKFSWCVGELYSGNVYHNYADEGQFHFMSFTPNNSHISNGYTSLYSVIAKCNHIINDIPAIAKKNGISKEAIEKAVGEAKMFRGMAYFLLAEYWGPTPIVLNNSNNVTNDLAPQITKANRKSLYTLIEKDWKEAYDALPDKAQPNCRVWKASAAGMLTKLYVTMASCQANLNQKGAYICEDPDKYYDMAIEMGNKTLGLCNYLEQGYEAYDKMFQPGTQSPEILFALCFEQGVYAQGCSRQIQFARSKQLAAGGDAYGGEKGLTTTLFNSYEPNDIRLKATSYYNGHRDDDTYSDNDVLKDAKASGDAGHYYLLDDGSKYYYFMNPGKSLKKKALYGNEPLSAIFNHCRKFVYSVKPLNSPFSIDLTIPFLRTADVYLLVAEAKMGKAQKDVAGTTTEGVKEINIVRTRAGLSEVDKIVFCDPEEYKPQTLKGSATVVDAKENEVEIEVYCDQYEPTYDLMQERRHEFALENQNWLDIKRLYYRNPDAAKSYIKEQDRAYTFGEKFGNESKDLDKKAGYQRQYIINALSVKAHEVNPDSYKEQATEGEIQYDKLDFFLPIPASVPSTSTFTQVKDYCDQILNGKYPY